MQNNVSSSIKRIFSVLFNIYLFITIFDPMRESLDFGSLNTLISLFRDALIFFLLLLVLFFVPKKKNSLFILIYICSICLLIILSFFTNENSLSVVLSLYGLIKAFCVVFIILNLHKIYYGHIEVLVRIYLFLVLINYFVTLYIFFFKRNLIAHREFTNRICVGNPSMQSIIFISAFSLTFYFKLFNKYINLIFSLLFLIATVSTITSTAIVGVIAICGITLFDKKYRKFWIFTISIGIIFFLFVVNYFNINIKIFTGLFVAKWNELLNVVYGVLGLEGNFHTEYQSFSIRDLQVAKFWQQWEPISFLFGDGIFSMMNQSKYMIENTYVAVFRDFGAIGFATFIFFLLKYGLFGIKNYFSKKSYGSLLAIIIIAAYSYTLYVFAGMSILIQLFFFFYVSLKLDEQRNNIRT